MDKEKQNKNDLLWALNPQPRDHLCNVLLTLKWHWSVEQEIWVMHHFTCWTLIISWISTAWLYKRLNDSHKQPIILYKGFSTSMYWYLLLYVCELTADGSICIASVNTDDSIWGTALAVKLLVKLLSSFMLCSISCSRRRISLVRTCTTYWYSVLCNYNKTYKRHKNTCFYFHSLLNIKHLNCSGTRGYNMGARPGSQRKLWERIQNGHCVRSLWNRRLLRVY